jgi:hypothetical protein
VGSPICPECGYDLVDVNEGYARLRWGPVSYECQTPGCPRNPNAWEKCPGCDGSGHKWIPQTISVYPLIKHCETCKGTGRVPAEEVDDADNQEG